MSDYTKPTTAESLSMYFDRLVVNVKNFFRLFIICLVIHLVLIVFANVYYLFDNYIEIGKYLWYHFLLFKMPDWSLLKSYMDENIIQPNLKIILRTSLVWMIGVAFIIYSAKRHSQGVTATKYVRGEKLKTEAELVKDIKRSGAQVGIMLTQELGIPFYIETGHLGVAGATGAGKTQTTNRIISGLKKRQTRMIIHELKGDYYSTFSTEKDLLFCPLDQRHMGKYGGWSIFSSIKTTYDIETVACSLIPDQPNVKEPFWYIAPRQLFASILRYCFISGKTKNKDIWDALNLSIGDMIACLKGVPGAEIGLGHIVDRTKAASDVKSVLLSYVQPLQYMCDSDGDFVIEDWLRDGEGSIYVLNYTKIRAAMAPILSLFLDLLIKRVNALDADLHRRIAFIIDEAPQLQKLNSLIELLAISRDRGAMNLLTWQTNSQWRKLYGREDADTILGNLNSKIVCKLADVDTCKYFAELFGGVEEIRTTKSTSIPGRGSKGNQGGVTFSEHIHERFAVSKEDLRRLRVTQEGYEAFVKLANYDIAKVKFPIVNYKKRVEEFKPRPGIDLDYIKMKWEELQAEVQALTGGGERESEHNQEMGYDHFE